MPIRFGKIIFEFLNAQILQRLFEKIVIDSVEIDSNIGETNVIRTFWQKDRVDVTDGILSLDKAKLNKRPSKVYVKFTHLQHKDFTYKFKVSSTPQFTLNQFNYSSN